MDIFLQKIIFIRIIILLIILNLFSIGIFLYKDFFGNANKIVAEHQYQPQNKEDKDETFSSKNPQDTRETRELGDILERELNFSKEQVAQIQVLRSKFYHKEKDLFKKMKGIKRQLTKEVFNKTTNDTLVKSLIKEISIIEYQKEMMRFEQIQELKTICTPAQLDKFDDLMEEMKQYFRVTKPVQLKN